MFFIERYVKCICTRFKNMFMIVYVFLFVFVLLFSDQKLCRVFPMLKIGNKGSMQEKISLILSLDVSFCLSMFFCCVVFSVLVGLPQKVGYTMQSDKHWHVQTISCFSIEPKS